jgi:hypothetical protein
MISPELLTDLVSASGYADTLAEPRYIVWLVKGAVRAMHEAVAPQTKMLATRQAHGSAPVSV